MNGFHRNGQGYMGVTKDMLPKHLNPFKQVANGCAPQETDNFFNTMNQIQYNGRLTENIWLVSSLYWSHQKGDYRILIPEENPENNVLWNYDLNYHMFGGNVTAKFRLNEFTINTGVNSYMYTRRHIGTNLPNDTIVNICHGYGPELFNNRGNKPDVNVFVNGIWNHRNFTVTGNIQYLHTQLNYSVNKPGDSGDIPFNHKWDFLNAGADIEYMTGNIGNVYARWAMTHREPSRVDMFGGEYYTGELFASTTAERVNDIEIGYDMHINRFNANLNLFYMKFNNELIATGELSSSNGLPLHTQNNSYRTGIELAMTYNIFRNFDLIVNGSWSSNKIKVNGENGYVKTNNNTYSPEWLLYAEASYKFNHGFTAGLSANYRSKMYVDISNEHYLPAAFNLNAYIMKSFKKVDLSLHLNNITNRLNTSAGSVADNIMYYHVDVPFNFFINARFNF